MAMGERLAILEARVEQMVERLENLEDHLFPPDSADDREIEARTIALIQESRHAS